VRLGRGYDGADPREQDAAHCASAAAAAATAVAAIAARAVRARVFLVDGHKAHRRVEPCAARDGRGHRNGKLLRADAALEARDERGIDVPERARRFCLLHHADRDGFAVEEGGKEERFDRVPDGMPEVE
jgi:hypothetical protein